MTNRTPEIPARKQHAREPRPSSQVDDAAPASLSNGATTDGDSLPELPARDAARLLVQSPHKLFLYFGFERDPRAALRHAFGVLAERFELGARLVDLEHDAIGEPIAAGGSDNLWLDARPRRAYRAEVGFFAEGLSFVCVLTSNVVETPPDAASELTDDAEDFHTDAQDFDRLLAASGFAARARESAPLLTDVLAGDAAATVGANARANANTGVGANAEVSANAQVSANVGVGLRVSLSVPSSVSPSASSSFSLSGFAPSSFALGSASEPSR
jgi:hypothetical protein